MGGGSCEALELAIREDSLNGLQIIDFGQDVQLENWRKMLEGAAGDSVAEVWWAVGGSRSELTRHAATPI